ncbi:unnamed protein product [Prunus brigantina]
MSMRLVDPFSFCTFQSFLQAVQHYLIGCYCLAIVFGNNHHVFLSRCRWHRSYQVNGPLHEWPWAIMLMVHLN